MSNYNNYNFNNNNRGYGNQNNMYNQNQNNMYNQNQNNFSNQNYNRQQGNNYNQNNYNPGNYNQNNNFQQPNYNNQNQQNQQNNNVKPLISAYMGRLLIKSETLDVFSKSLKTTEWTKNPNYLFAKNVDVRMKINLKGQLNDFSIPRNRFNEYQYNTNFNMNTFYGFIKEVIDNNNKRKEKSMNEKINFMKNNFPTEKNDININDLYIKIGENRKDVLKKDYKLYGKVERILPSIKPFVAPKKVESQKNNFSNDNKNQVTTPSPFEDKKTFSNDNKKETPTTPSPFQDENNSANNDGKIFTNTPGF